jgi:EAL domain-containing protein (putative c-di-GMP-specific phosphodiesterase class I)/GGDEF domain-containing protein
MLDYTMKLFKNLALLERVPHVLFCEFKSHWKLVYANSVAQEHLDQFGQAQAIGHEFESPNLNTLGNDIGGPSHVYRLAKGLVVQYWGQALLLEESTSDDKKYGSWVYNKESKIFNISFNPWSDSPYLYSHFNKTESEMNIKVGTIAMKRKTVTYPSYVGEFWFYMQSVPTNVIMAELKANYHDVRIGVYEVTPFETLSLSADVNPTYLDPTTRLPSTYYYMSLFRHLVTNDSHPMACSMVLDIKQLERTLNAFGEQYVTMLFKTLDNFIKQEISEHALLFIYNHSAMGLFVPVSGEEEAKVYAQRIVDYFETPWYYDNFVFFSTVSIGLALYPPDSSDPLTLVRFADMALNSAGDNTGPIHHYQANLQDLVTKNIILFGDIRNAMDNNEFIMYYQPQVEMGTGKIVGAEALIRWFHGNKGFIPPSDFIPELEKMGSTYLLDQHVMNLVAMDQKKMTDLGLGDMMLSLNLSASSLNSEAIDEDAIDIISMNGANPHRIVIEVTESADIFSANNVEDRIRALRSHGFSISIDDFGTGYSSLNYLTSLPINAIKIDKFYTDGYLTDEKKAFITKKIDEIAQVYQLDLTIEGVETKEQVEKMKKELQPHIKIQGYYYYKPMPLDDFIALLKEKRKEATSE